MLPIPSPDLRDHEPFRAGKDSARQAPGSLRESASGRTFNLRVRYRGAAAADVLEMLPCNASGAVKSPSFARIFGHRGAGRGSARRCKSTDRLDLRAGSDLTSKESLKLGVRPPRAGAGSI